MQFDASGATFLVPVLPGCLMVMPNLYCAAELQQNNKVNMLSMAIAARTRVVAPHVQADAERQRGQQLVAGACAAQMERPQGTQRSQRRARAVPLHKVDKVLPSLQQNLKCTLAYMHLWAAHASRKLSTTQSDRDPRRSVVAVHRLISVMATHARPTSSHRPP